jgi:hypothetical protein
LTRKNRKNASPNGRKIPLIDHLLKRLPKREPPGRALALPKLRDKPHKERIPRGFLIEETF